MRYDEHEIMVEYAEMTSFNFNSKEFLEVKKDFMECKEAANCFSWFVKNFTNNYKKLEA